jgi:hypothetical protein
MLGHRHPHPRRFSFRPEILQHDPGLAASPVLAYGSAAGPRRRARRGAREKTRVDSSRPISVSGTSRGRGNVFPDGPRSLARAQKIGQFSRSLRADALLPSDVTGRSKGRPCTRRTACWAGNTSSISSGRPGTVLLPQPLERSVVSRQSASKPSGESPGGACVIGLQPCFAEDCTRSAWLLHGAPLPYTRQFNDPPTSPAP